MLDRAEAHGVAPISWEAGHLPSGQPSDVCIAAGASPSGALHTPGSRRIRTRCGPNGSRCMRAPASLPHSGHERRQPRRITCAGNHIGSGAPAPTLVCLPACSLPPDHPAARLVRVRLMERPASSTAPQQPFLPVSLSSGAGPPPCTGPIESASHAETSVLQLVQAAIIRAQVCHSNQYPASAHPPTYSVPG